MVEMSSDWYWVQDEQFRFVEVGGLDMEALDTDIVIGKARAGRSPASRRCPRRSWEQHRAKLERHESFSDFVFLRYNKAGELRYLSVSGEPLFDEKGKFIGYHGVGKDITERARDQKALEDSEKRYRTLFDVHPQPMWVVDAKTLAFLAVNGAAMRLYGYSKEEFLALTADQIRPEEDVDDLRRAFADWSNNYSQRIWRHRKKNGEVIPVQGDLFQPRVRRPPRPPGRDRGPDRAPAGRGARQAERAALPRAARSSGEPVRESRMHAAMLKQRTLKIADQRLRRRPAHRPEGAHERCAPRRPTPASCSAASISPSPVDIPARAELVGEARLASTLIKDGVKVHTVEHLMSALSGLGIDNAFVDLDAPELPIMDGSASPFVLLLQQAGLEEQAAPKRFLRVKKTVEVKDGDKWARLEPYEGFRLSFSIDFRHPVIERSTQSVTVDFAETSYLKEIARARTFGFMHEVEDLQGQRPRARRRAGQRGGARRARRAERRRPALRRRVHPPQAARRDRRPVPARPAAARRLHRAQVRPRAQQPAGARRARRCRRRSRPWCSSAPRKRRPASPASPPSRARCLPSCGSRSSRSRSRSAFTVLAWLLTGEPRWKRLAWQVFKYSVFGLLAILLLFAGEALLH